MYVPMSDHVSDELISQHIRVQFVHILHVYIRVYVCIYINLYILLL